MNLKGHLEASMEEHLSKTWSKLSKTTERLNRLEEVELDKEYMQRLLHRNYGEINDLRLEVENMGLCHDIMIKGPRHNIKGLQDDTVELRRLYMKQQDEIDALRRLVQTTTGSKVKAHEEKHPNKPLKLKSKTYTGKKMDDSRSPAYKYVHHNVSNTSIFSRPKKQTL